MSIFLEVVMRAQDLLEADIHGRDEIEEPLQDMLERADLGEVTGGGSGKGVTIIDVELTCEEDQFVGTIRLIRGALRAAGVPRNTVIKRYTPQLAEFAVYDAGPTS